MSSGPVAALSSASEHPEPTGRITTLPNGLRIITQPRRETKAVAMHLAVLAGSRDEDATTAGAAHLMEHMFFQGTERAPTSDAVSGPIIARGGVFNASTERETIGFFIEAPATATAIALERLGDVIANARFDESRLESARAVVIEELRRRANDAAMLARDAFNDLVLNGHPAQHSPGGTPENIRAITLESVARYRAERFRAGNMVLAVVGRIEHADIVAQVERWFGTLTPGASVRESADPPPQVARRREIQAGRTSAQIAIGFATPGANSIERFPLAVTAAVLGRAGRRLRRELREGRGLTYTVSARYGALSDVGVFGISTAVDVERTDEAVDVVREELQRIASEPVSQDELAAAKGFIEGRTYLNEERNLAQARRHSILELLNVPLSLDQYVTRIQRVTADQINATAQRYLHPDKVLVVVVRP